MNLLNACRQTARRTFRIQSLRPEQESAMLAVLNGRDALVALPTGFGKSLIYQVPAMIFERPTIVISPLIALMADQEQRAQEGAASLWSRFTAGCAPPSDGRRLSGSRKAAAWSFSRRQRRSSRPRPLPCSNARGRRSCASTRPTASPSGGTTSGPPTCASATPANVWAIRRRLPLRQRQPHRVREDIAERLRLDKPRVLVAPAHRENLRLTVDIVPGSEKFPAAARRIKRLQRPGIIYCATTTAVDEVAGALGRARIPVTRYHGKMRAADRDAAQRQFMNPSRRLIMVATTAFGMGIDKPNIRYILHYQTPGSLEQYVQEIGRAGRDGRPAHCILLFDPADLEIQEHLQALSRPSVRHLERLEDALTAWTGEQRAPTAETLAYSAGVPARICEVLLSDLQEAGLIERDQEGGINIVVPPESFKTACAIWWRSSRPSATRASGVFDCFPTTRSRRSAAACSCGATLERTTHRVVERATAAALTVLRPRLRARHAWSASRPPLRRHQERMPPCVSPRRQPHGAWFGAKAPRRSAPRMRAPEKDGSAQERKK